MKRGGVESKGFNVYDSKDLLQLYNCWMFFYIENFLYFLLIKYKNLCAVVVLSILLCQVTFVLCRCQ